MHTLYLYINILSIKIKILKENTIKIIAISTDKYLPLIK